MLAVAVFVPVALSFSVVVTGAEADGEGIAVIVVVKAVLTSKDALIVDDVDAMSLCVVDMLEDGTTEPETENSLLCIALLLAVVVGITDSDGDDEGEGLGSALLLAVVVGITETDCDGEGEGLGATIGTKPAEYGNVTGVLPIPQSTSLAVAPTHDRPLERYATS
jgi:hypothetical protein